MLLRSNKYQEGGGGGININGDEVQYTVKTGVTINKGDFVQIDDSISPTTSPETTTGERNYIFTLSDGRQITIGLLGNAALTYNSVRAIIDEFGPSGIVSTNMYTVLSELSATRVKIIELGNDQFLLAVGRLYKYGSSGSYYSTTFDFYKVTFDVSNDTFSSVSCGSIGSISGTTYSGGYYRSNPTLFSFSKINTTDIFILCSQIQNQPNVTGNLTAIVYDFENQILKTKQVVTEVSFSDSATEQYYNDIYFTNVGVNRYIYNYNTSKLYIFDYDGSSAITYSSVVQSDLGILISVDNNKFVSFSGTTAKLYNIVGESLVLLGTYTCPMTTVYSAYYFNNKHFVINQSNYENRICQMIYDSNNNDISFSDVSASAIYDQGNIYINSQYLCTYDLAKRLIVKEINGNFFSFRNLKTIKKYSNRIDGVAAENGTGGNTITIIVPATN